LEYVITHLKESVFCYVRQLRIDQLNVMGVNSIEWFRSYLSDRVQFVALNNVIVRTYGGNMCCAPRKYSAPSAIFGLYK
jgi:hypothetical protein